MKTEIVSMQEAFTWAKARTIVAETTDRHDETTLTFSDGTKLVAKSECDGPYSEVTQGEGIQPPTFWLITPTGS